MSARKQVYKDIQYVEVNTRRSIKYQTSVSASTN